MKMEDAKRFPLVGSACLFGLFCAFKFLDPEWVNWVISFYFTAAGAAAVAATLSPIFEAVPKMDKSWTKKFNFEHNLPTFLFGSSPYSGSVTLTPGSTLAFMAAAAVGYQYFTTKHWR